MEVYPFLVDERGHCKASSGQTEGLLERRSVRLVL